MRVAYPGREGAHSAAACALLFPEAETEPLPSFSDVVEAVAFGRFDGGVLPIESSVSGPVSETHDLLVHSGRRRSTRRRSSRSGTSSSASRRSR